MTNKNARPSLIAPLGGVMFGVAVFLGIDITTGKAIIPTVDSIATGSHPLSEPVRLADESVATAAPGGTYQTVCITCHQAEGQGVPGAFPPLAGSEWIGADPGIPIRVVLLGLSGEIEVKGAKFNAVMPPPPGLNDEKIAEAITFARTHFGNHAAAVTPAMVKGVREALAGRTSNMTPTELKALLSAGAAPDVAEGVAGGAAAPAPGAPEDKAAPAGAPSPKAP